MNIDAISRKMIRSTIQDLQRRREEIFNAVTSLSGRKDELLEEANQIGAKIEWLTDHVAELESHASSPSITEKTSLTNGRKKRITLDVTDELHKKAHIYARKKGVTVKHLVTQFLEGLK